jgi:hypothetical protein
LFIRLINMASSVIDKQFSAQMPRPANWASKINKR